jgi:CspA family cold shock protein
MSMLRGAVRMFDNQKGYGFIRMEGNPEDIFVHHREIRMEGYRALDPGDVVEFKLRRDAKGLKAFDVVRVQAVASAETKAV